MFPGLILFANFSYICMLDVACCLQPFVDDVHPLQSLFLPRLYALLIPVVAGVIAMIGLGIIVKLF